MDTSTTGNSTHDDETLGENRAQDATIGGVAVEDDHDVVAAAVAAAVAATQRQQRLARVAARADEIVEEEKEARAIALRRLAASTPAVPAQVGQPASSLRQRHQRLQPQPRPVPVPAPRPTPAAPAPAPRYTFEHDDVSLRSPSPDDEEHSSRNTRCGGRRHRRGCCGPRAEYTYSYTPPVRGPGFGCTLYGPGCFATPSCGPCGSPWGLCGPCGQWPVLPLGPFTASCVDGVCAYGVGPAGCSVGYGAACGGAAAAASAPFPVAVGAVCNQFGCDTVVQPAAAVCNPFGCTTVPVGPPNLAGRRDW